jgi:hypothetical protein
MFLVSQGIKASKNKFKDASQVLWSWSSHKYVTKAIDDSTCN